MKGIQLVSIFFPWEIFTCKFCGINFLFDLSIKKVYQNIRYNNVRLYGKKGLMTYICNLFRINPFKI